jgi:hypothetical protein
MKPLKLLLAAVFILLWPTHETKAQWVQTNGSYSGWVNCFAVSPNGTGGMNLFAGTDGGGVFLSTNNGTSWTAVNTGLPSHTGVWSLAVSGRSLFAGTTASGVYLSTNNGTSWAAVNTGLPSYSNVWSLAVSGTNLFAGTIGVYLSTNNGTTWTQTGLTDTFVYSLAVSGTSLFAGTGASGVYLSTDNGTSWTAVNTGLPSYSDVWSLAVSGTNLFAGTEGGVWRRPLSEMITSVKGLRASGPEAYALQQSYPNPFNPSTTIRFSLPKSGYVTLKVYDLVGREVETLVEGVRAAGTYSVEWIPNNLASGVYLYRMQAGTFTDVKRLLLLK